MINLEIVTNKLLCLSKFTRAKNFYMHKLVKSDIFYNNKNIIFEIF